MKASELRIGNYIMARSDNVIEQVLKIEKNKINACNYTYFEPIPLTEEWLIKFNFTKEDNKETVHHGNFFSKWIMDYKYCFAFAEFRKDWGFYQEYTDPIDLKEIGKKYFISCGIKHVHQLQNLYFALTGEELSL